MLIFYHAGNAAYLNINTCHTLIIIDGILRYPITSFSVRLRNKEVTDGVPLISAANILLILAVRREKNEINIKVSAALGF